MKKNISINMFGQLFNIDEDAYQVLSRYLESMKQYFMRREGGNEIAEDIERHVAELMWQHSHSGTQPVSIEDVNAIISQIGNPSEIDNSEAQGTEATEDTHEAEDTRGAEAGKGFSHLHEAWNSFQSSMGKSTNKRYLFRNPDDKIIRGVLSGLSRYLGWESPTLLRLVFSLLMIASLFAESGYFLMCILLAYIVLAIIIPVPRNAEERLKMRGEDITPDSLNREMLRESNDAVSSEQRRASQNGGCLMTFLKVVLFLLLLPVLFFGALIIFVLVLILFVPMALVFGMTGVFGSLCHVSVSVFPSFVESFISDNHLIISLALCSLLCVIILPIMAVASIIKNRRKPDSKSHVWLYMLLILISLSVLISSAVILAVKGQSLMDKFNNYRQVQVDCLSNESADSLFVAIPIEAGTDSTGITLSSDSSQIIIKHKKCNKK